MSQTGQLALELGTREAVWRASEWARKAERWIYYATAHFTADTLRAAIGDPPAHGDAIGAVLRNARKAGLIRAVGHTTSVRPERHGAQLVVWERA